MSINVGIPNSVINHVHRFLFFVMYARSGHSIIASMMDAHPNMVIAHKNALFVKWEHEPAQYRNKTWTAQFNGFTVASGPASHFAQITAGFSA